MAITLAQNFYKETITVAWAAGAGNFYVSAKPTISEGYLVISPNNSSLREIVKFTATGTDGTGDYVTITAPNRGLGGTTDQSHVVGESVFMNVTAQTIEEISDALDQIVAAGAQDASTITKGITKLSTAPASASDPIAVGVNDTTILPTSDEKAALAGDGGVPSGDNPYVTRSRTKTAGATINGATTPVPVYQNKTDNEFYACDANDTSAMKFAGFAVSDGTDGNDIEVQFSGIVSGFTGLSEGEKYYVQDAVGTIGTSIGTYEILVGVAISETELMIQKGKRRAAGTESFNSGSTTTVAIDLGFRPSVIRVHAVASHRGVVKSHGVYVNGSQSVSYLEDTDGNGLFGVGSTTGFVVYLPTDTADADVHRVAVSSVTDTGFSFVESTSVAPAGNVEYTWEAEGEL